jgi:predicted PurR-regulated permease PerM
MLVSSKQAGHYVVPAVPVYAIAAALILAPTAGRLVERVNDRRWNHRITLASVVILVGTLAASLVPALGRDRVRLEGLDQLTTEVPHGVTIGICPAANADWGLHAWFERRFRVSLDARNQPRHEWFLQTAAAGPECPPSDCRVVTQAAGSMVLMKCRGAR